MEALVELTDDPEATVRRLAIRALCSGHLRHLSKENAQRIASVVQRKLEDPDLAVRTDAAVRVSIFGSLEARVAAIPLLVKSATGQESLDGWNAYLGVHRCIREFASGLTDKGKAEVAFRGFQQFDKDFLKNYLQESHEKFRWTERGDGRPLFKAAAEHGIGPRRRQFAVEVLTWLPRDEG